jgi:hypothetical protein
MEESLMKKYIYLPFCLLSISVLLTQQGNTQAVFWHSLTLCDKGGCRSILHQNSFPGFRNWRLDIQCNDGEYGFWQGDGMWGGNFVDCDFRMDFVGSSFGKPDCYKNSGG